MMKKTLALLLALALPLGAGMAMAETATTEPLAVTDPVLATVGDETVTLSDVEAVLPQLNEYMGEEADIPYAVNFVVQQRLLAQKVKELGFDQFTAEEEATFAAEAQQQWDEGVSSYVNYYLSEDTEAARKELQEQAAAFYAEQGFSLEVLTDNLRQRAAYDRLTQSLMADYVPSEEEVQETFQQFGSAYATEYENNVMSYEYNTIYNQQPSWYTPAGYRGIIHILLIPDATLMDNYTSLRSAYEEQQSDLNSEAVESTTTVEGEASPAPEATQAAQETVTLEMVEAARQAILDSRKADIEAIQARLAAGESFETLVKELGQDPGMESQDNLTNGYMVHKDSVVWDPAFTQAAFSEKMQQVGDVSDPVVGTNGIHILRYLRDVPSGLIMTDAIRQEIVDYLLAMKENEAYTLAFEAWRQDIPVTLNQEAIDAAVSAAQQANQQVEVPEDDTLQAVPDASEPPVEATTAP